MISLNDLTLGYDRRPAVHHLSGSFEQGSLTAVVGPNGSGKSTLLKGVMGILKPLGGTLEISAAVRQVVAYLPQKAEVDRSFPITVMDTVLMGNWRRSGIFGKISRDMLERTRRALDAVGLNGFGNRLLGSLSSGQFQRVLFARIIVQDASVILLDEPFVGVDFRTTEALLEIIRSWHAEGRTILIVVHDMNQAREHFPSSLLLAREPVAWGPTLDVLTPENLRRARGLVEAWKEEADYCVGEGL
jgi:zinc/manganese transport system ATP-binding protein